VTIAFLALAWLTVGLRCFVRIKMVKAFGLDDYLMVVSLGIFTIFCACQLTGIHYGMGSHNADLTLPNIIEALKYQTLCELFYIADTALIKCSVGFLLLRITPNGAKTYRYILYVSMVVLSLWTIITFFIILFQCRPVSFAWDQRSGKGHCTPSTSIANAGYAFSAMDILFDWLFALLPVPMLWDVKMSIQVKASLILILGLGVFASTATIVRLKYIVALTDPTDILYAFARTLIWTVTEAGIGISAASIATLRPLFKSFHIHGFSNSGTGSRSRQTPRTGYVQSYDLGYINGGTETKTTTHTRALSEGNTSQESILEHGKIPGRDGGISKRMDVEVTYESQEQVPRAM